MDMQNNKATPKKDTPSNLYEYGYDDGDIPEIDKAHNAKDIIPDEVPRRDGPGGN